MEQHGLARQFTMVECLNESSECPKYLRDIAVAAFYCRQVKDDDLTYKLMRINLDWAILRETLAFSPMKKENVSTSSKARNSIV